MRAPAIKILMLATMRARWRIRPLPEYLGPSGSSIAKRAAELRVRLVPPTTCDRVGESDRNFGIDQSRTLQPLKKVLADIRSVDPQPPDLSLERCSVNVAPSEVVEHKSRPDLVN